MMLSMSSHIALCLSAAKQLKVVTG